MVAIDEQAALRREVRRILNALPREHRLVLLLAYDEGLAAGEIAEALGLSVEEVASHRREAIALIRLAVGRRKRSCRG